MTTFLRESPLVTARRYVDAELAGKVATAHLTWLHEHPLMWLRALIQVKKDVQTHIAKARADIAHLKPTQGVSTTREQAHDWSIVRRRVETESLNRLHFIRIVEKRIDEVNALIGTEPFDRTTTGEAVNAMLTLAQLASEDDMEAVINMAHACARRWSGTTS